MAQRLITEGNDAIALAVLCKKRNLPPPLGYETSLKFRDEFVQNAGGYSQAIIAFKIAIEGNNYTNIGLILDANDAGATARWKEVRKIMLGAGFSEKSLVNADAQMGPKIIEDASMPTIGIWIMPNNNDNGYLEYFFADLVPSKDPLWLYTEKVLSDLKTQTFNEIPRTRWGKAHLHTWLAWKKEPGKPFGQALEANYFDIQAPLVQPFLDWFSATFQLT